MARGQDGREVLSLFRSDLGLYRGLHHICDHYGDGGQVYRHVLDDQYAISSVPIDWIAFQWVITNTIVSLPRPPRTAGYASGFVMLAWISNTVARPRAKKAAAIAIVNAMGNIGSIPGSYLWPSQYGPLYVKSFGAEIAILGFASVSALALRFYLQSLNKRLDAEETPCTSVPVESGVHRSNARGFRYLY